MTVGRVAGFLILMGLIGGGVIWLRSEEVRSAVRIQHYHHNEIALRRALWRNQLEISRLKSPAVVTARVEPMELKVVPAHGASEKDVGAAWVKRQRAARRE